MSGSMGWAVIDGGGGQNMHWTNYCSFMKKNLLRLLHIAWFP